MGEKQNDVKGSQKRLLTELEVGGQGSPFVCFSSEFLANASCLGKWEAKMTGTWQGGEERGMALGQRSEKIKTVPLSLGQGMIIFRSHPHNSL